MAHSVTEQGTLLDLRMKNRQACSGGLSLFTVPIPYVLSWCVLLCRNASFCLDKPHLIDDRRQCNVNRRKAVSARLIARCFSVTLNQIPGPISSGGPRSGNQDGRLCHAFPLCMNSGKYSLSLRIDAAIMQTSVEHTANTLFSLR